MPIDAPGLEHSVNVPGVARTSDVVDNFVATVFDKRRPDLLGERFENFVPGGSLPLTFASCADSFKRKKDALRIVDLIYRGWSFGAIPSTRARMQRIAFELANIAGVLIDISEQSACGFAVEAGGWHKRVTPLDFFR